MPLDQTESSIDEKLREYATEAYNRNRADYAEAARIMIALVRADTQKRKLLDALIYRGALRSVHGVAGDIRDQAKRPWSKPSVVDFAAASSRPAQAARSSSAAAWSTSDIALEIEKPRQPPRSLDAFVQLGIELKRSILDQWEIEGRRLGDWTGAEIAALAVKAENQARGAMKSARFYSALAEMTPADKRVRDCVTGENADAIWNTIDSEAA